MTAPSKPLGPKLSLVKGDGPTDEQLLAAFAQGDSQALGAFFERHRTAVYRVGLRFSGHREDALELTQKTFLHALSGARRKLPSPAADGVPLRAWLLRIAVNLSKNFVRDAGKRPQASLEAVDAQAVNAVTPEVLVARTQLQALARAAVKDLSPRQQEVFALRVDGELSFAEVAQALGLTEGNAKVHFHYAVKALTVAVRAAAGESP